ncbi:hypothetical protein [Streptomyces virginiae]|uniref:hypothetical protein n=1 Tax=Streptomyces virginiae TaxID=1961 RepID=UPI0034218E21
MSYKRQSRKKPEMKRTNVYADEEDLQAIKEGAVRLGISEAELLRRGIKLAAASVRTWEAPAVRRRFRGSGRTVTKADIAVALTGETGGEAAEQTAAPREQRASKGEPQSETILTADLGAVDVVAGRGWAHIQPGRGEAETSDDREEWIDLLDPASGESDLWVAVDRRGHRVSEGGNRGGGLRLKMNWEEDRARGFAEAVLEQITDRRLAADDSLRNLGHALRAVREQDEDAARLHQRTVAWRWLLRGLAAEPPAPPAGAEEDELDKAIHRILEGADGGQQR